MPASAVTAATNGTVWAVWDDCSSTDVGVMVTLRISVGGVTTISSHADRMTNAAAAHSRSRLDDCMNATSTRTNAGLVRGWEKERGRCHEHVDANVSRR